MPYFLRSLWIAITISAFLQLRIIRHPNITLVIFVQRRRHKGARKRGKLDIMIIRAATRLQNRGCWSYVEPGLGEATPRKENGQKNSYDRPDDDFELVIPPVGCHVGAAKR